MEQIVVVGAGIMGLRIAGYFHGRGHPVALLDPSQAALDRAGAACAGLVRATHAPALDDAWRAAALVIEVVPEDLALKQRVMAGLEDWFAPQTMLASNTSGLRSADLSAGLRHPERFLITHFFNPADLIPAVEVVPAPETHPEVVDRVAAILQNAGKKPAVLQADVPGFIANRLQHAMMRECFHLIETGVADAETIDVVTRYSIGVRLALIGPFLQRDSNGLDTHLSIAEYLYPDLAARQTPPPLLAGKVQAGAVGRKAGQGFYQWDSAQQARMDRIEELLKEVIALSAQAD